jgi:serine/threonine-protein kinase
LGALADTDYRRTLGRYALYGEIAAGGMATVHYGRVLGDEGFARVVAIKCLLPELAKDPAFVRMFLAEGRLASRVRHPNVVATHDVVSLEGELFHVMEYVAGDSLSRLMRKCREIGEPIPPRIAVAIVCGLLEGLHAAHEAKSEKGRPLGLVHRDVSPQNCLVGVDGTSRVLDFGVATATNMVDEAPDHIKGKVSYMAPEQLAHESVDRRTDVYAASVVLWEALTGQRLFKADDISTLIVNIMADPVRLPSELAKDIPRELDGVVMKGLEREIKDRWASARDMAVLLEKALPPAQPREVGEWVLRVGGERIQYRSDVVTEIETQSLAKIPVPEVARAPKPTLPNATAELQALNENALPSAVEKALASDPKIRALFARRSQPVIVVEKPISDPPPAPMAPSKVVPAVTAAPKASQDPKKAPSTPPPPPKDLVVPPPPPPAGPGRAIAIGAAVIALIAGAAYFGTVLGNVDESKPKPVPSGPTSTDPEEAIGIGKPQGSGAKAVDAGDCANPFTVDSFGNKKPKPQCFGTKP